MKLIEISIKNFRSIKEISEARINSFQAIIGENNSGKSNILRAIEVFLSPGSGGATEEDFNDESLPIIIRAKFKINSPRLKKIWRPYTLNDELILEKRILIDLDEEQQSKKKIIGEFHGYKAEPKEWFLSVAKIQDKFSKPDWKNIVEENKLPGYFIVEGRCNKTEYSKGLDKYLAENEVVYDEISLSETQALGFSTKASSNLPKFYLLKANSNYAEEIDKRSSSSSFRKLMADLTERILKKDENYKKIEDTLKTLDCLLNNVSEQTDSQLPRLESISTIEDKMREIIQKLMPSVKGIKLKVATEDIGSIFSRGIQMKVDDGVETEVLLKGSGLQRCIIFSLLQALILNERKQLIPSNQEQEDNFPMILAIEEPELYIHPQLGKLFYDVLESFSIKDQVVYTTHSPRFIDVYKYESIGIIRKLNNDGTKFVNCNHESFVGLSDRDVFKKMTQLNSDVNELFFAKNIILVEGANDKIAVIETAKNLGLIDNRLEERDITVIVAGGKRAIPFFIRVLNAFDFVYCVVHDLDMKNNNHKDSLEIEKKKNAEIFKLAKYKVFVFDDKLEDYLSNPLEHIQDQYQALEIFSVGSNISERLKSLVKEVVESFRIESSSK